MQVLQAVALMATTITAGLVAGLMAAFAYAVMPGLAQTGERVFVATMQRINIAIVNVWFMIIFLGTLVFGLVAAITHMRADTWPVAWWTIIGLAFLSAIRLSRIRFALPACVQLSAVSPLPCNRYNTG